jgi:kynurenine formamidase
MSGLNEFPLDRGISIYENLAKLGKWPFRRLLFTRFPPPLTGCTGSPVRAVDLIQESSRTTNLS